MFILELFIIKSIKEVFNNFSKSLYINYYEILGIFFSIKFLIINYNKN